MIRMAVVAAALAAGLMLAGCTQSVVLFNGQNLNGWTTYVQDETVDPAAIWSVRDGVLRCEGQPFGYIRTVESYSNYVLELEWRWPEEPTNSGVLLHAVGPDKIWPQCIEAQLRHERAGDIVTIQPGSTVTVNCVRYQPEGDSIFNRAPRPQSSSEYEPGRWNHYKIVCRGEQLDIYVNGVHQNSATDVWPSAGAIGLQSEGSPIEFRNIQLRRLEP